MVTVATALLDNTWLPPKWRGGAGLVSGWWPYPENSLRGNPEGGLIYMWVTIPGRLGKQEESMGWGIQWVSSGTSSNSMDVSPREYAGRFGKLKIPWDWSSADMDVDTESRADPERGWFHLRLCGHMDIPLQ